MDGLKLTWKTERDGGMLYIREGNRCIALMADDGRALTNGLEGTEDEARRIVACVNKLMEWSIEQLEDEFLLARPINSCDVNIPAKEIDSTLTWTEAHDERTPDDPAD